MQVKDIMSSPVFEVAADTNVKRVIELMISERISGLPVVDASGRPVGIVSEGDLIRRAELGTADAALKQIALVAPNPAPASAAAGPAPTFPVTGTLNQVMRGILFPSSNVLFDVQTKDPGAGSKGGVAHGDAATTSNRYGDVYAPWMVVDAAAISIAEIGPVLMQPGRRCENGKPVPVDRTDWKQYVQGVVEAGRAAYRASQRRSQDAVSDATNQISDACANCHRVYRDVPSAAMRCTPN